MQILVATLRGAVHQQQRAAAYAVLLPSLDYTPLCSIERSNSRFVFIFYNFDKGALFYFIEIANLHSLIILALENTLLASIIALKFG